MGFGEKHFLFGFWPKLDAEINRKAVWCLNVALDGGIRKLNLAVAAAQKHGDSRKNGVWEPAASERTGKRKFRRGGERER